VKSSFRNGVTLKTWPQRRNLTLLFFSSWLCCQCNYLSFYCS